MGTAVDIRGRSSLRTVPVAETGEDRPDLAGEPSLSFGCDSRRPVALAFDDPRAGSAFCPSMLPMCSRCTAPRNDEFAAEATDSVGLGGRLSGTSDTAVLELGEVNTSAIGRVGLLASRVLCGTASDVVDPLMIANLRRRSSNGAPPAPVLKSALIALCERGVPTSGLRMSSETAR